LSGAGSITDLSGNNLTNNAAIFLTVGTDQQAPTIKVSSPGNGEAKVSLNVQPVITFGEAMDLRSINERTVTLEDGIDALPMTMVLQNSNTELLLVPAKNLKPGKRHTLTLSGGPLGLRDVAGNFLATDEVIRFTASADGTLPTVVLSPTSGSTVVPQGAKLTAAFDDVLDPTTVNGDTVVVVGQSSQAVNGTVTLHESGRIVEFAPAQAWALGTWYTMTLRHGPQGIRKLSGNWSTQPVSTSFKATRDADTTAPVVEVTLNSTSIRRNQTLTVPPWGFDINIFAQDSIRYDLDLSSMSIQFTGPGKSPSSAELLRRALIGNDGLRYKLPKDLALVPGDYSLIASVKDLSGNLGKSVALSFKVATPDNRALPFEHTEVVWARFDLDRDANNRADFEDDMVKLGFTVEGDGAGTNKLMVDLIRNGIIRQVHTLFERRHTGGRTGADSIAVLVTPHQPFGSRYSQIACGGLDPNGTTGRKYGDKSTGVLGRAFFDYRNAVRTDLNTGTRPGLGVFAGEMFLFQAQLHKDLYPQFTTTFARRFLKLVPEMGGTPVGKHYLDRRVLSSSFEPSSAKAEEYRRWQDIMLAADDWATAIGIILAHEIGHTIGLTATGPNPWGLHGGNGLHNNWPGLTDIMTSAVAYDTLVTLNYRFRDLNLAYLRQRILMK
ncbi:MAG: Ig-like domain-containing protein, partial [Planctomycetota bacterium]